MSLEHYFTFRKCIKNIIYFCTVRNLIGFIVYIYILIYNIFFKFRIIWINHNGEYNITIIHYKFVYLLDTLWIGHMNTIYVAGSVSE